MREQIKQPQQASRTIQSKPKAANQASVQQILQRFQSRGNGQLNIENVQRQTIDDDELLQGKFKTAQRQEIDEDELLQGKFETVQREEFDDDELLQGKFGTIQRIEPDKKIPLQEKSEETHVLAPSSGEREANNTGLPDNLKTGVENMSGYSMDDVRVHYNSPKPAQLQALAYTQGTDIHVAPGQEKHLPHEAWHVVQQKQGRVQPTTQLQGININDNKGLEKEADVMGGRAKSQNKPIRGLEEKAVAKGTENIQKKRKKRRRIRRNDLEGILNDKKGRKKEHHVLVYGTEDARIQQRGQKADQKTDTPEIKAVSENLPDGFEKENEQPSGWATKGFYTVDRYNNYSWRDFSHDSKAYFSIFNPLYLKSNPSDAKIEQDLRSFTGKQTLKPEDESEVTKYQNQLLEHPSYSPLKTLRESDEFVTTKESVGKQKRDSLKGDPVGITEDEKEVAKSRFELQTRRACKFGLEYMNQKAKTRSDMGEIAFLSSVHGAQVGVNKKQDPTDSKFILEKTKTGDRPGGGSSSARVPITTSEQRKLFRIRSGNIGIRFYNSKGNLEKAPWNKSGNDFNKKGWLDYERKRREKYKALAVKLNIQTEGKTLKDLKKDVVEGLKKRYPEKSLSESIYTERIKAISYHLWENICEISSDTIWFVAESIHASIKNCKNDEELKKQVAYFISTLNLGYTEEENYNFGLALLKNEEIKKEKNPTIQQVAYYLQKIVKKKGKQDEYWNFAKKIYVLIQNSKDSEELKKQIAFEISMLDGRQHLEKQNYEYANKLLENKELQALIPLITYRTRPVLTDLQSVSK